MNCVAIERVVARASHPFVAVVKPHHLDSRYFPACRAWCSFLRMLPSLVRLSIQGNKVTSMSHFREYVIALTASLRGVPRRAGLQWLDGDVTIDDRIQAGHRFLQRKDRAAYRRELIMQQVVGIKNVPAGGVIDPAMAARVRTIYLPGVGVDKLKRFSWAPFTGCESLNLVRNNLKKVVGLEAMTRLRVLNLHSNRRAIVDNTLKQVAEFTTLVKVRLAEDAECAQSEKHLRKLRSRLIPNNGRLRQIESSVITIDERTDVLRRALGWSKDQGVNYKVKLAIMLSNVRHEERTFSPREVLQETLCVVAVVVAVVVAASSCCGVCCQVGALLRVSALSSLRCYM